MLVPGKAPPTGVAPIAGFAGMILRALALRQTVDAEARADAERADAKCANDEADRALRVVRPLDDGVGERRRGFVRRWW